MTGAHHQPQPTFLWQALLLLLPVLVLAAVGWLSLRQDNILAQHEATDRAQTLTDDLVPLLWNELIARETNGLPQRSFTMDAGGQLIFPPAYEPVPTPTPLDPTELNPEQRQLWQRLERTEAATPDDKFLLQAYRTFIDSDPPDRFAAAAHYGMGMLFMRQRDLTAAAESFGLVAEEYPDAVGESGLPLQPVAQFKLFEMQPREKGSVMDLLLPGSSRREKTRAVRLRQRNAAEAAFPAATLKHYLSLDTFCSNIVYHPTPLTPYFLREIQERLAPEIPEGGVTPGVLDKLNQAGTLEMREAIRKWQRTWTGHELARELFAAAGEHFHNKVSRASLPGVVRAKEKSTVDNPTETNRLWSLNYASGPGITIPRLFWFDTPSGWQTAVPSANASPASLEIEDQLWLAIQSDNNATGIGYACLTKADVETRMTRLLNNARPLPAYFGIGIDLAGKRLGESATDLRLWQYHHHGGKGGHVEKEYLTDLGGQASARATNALAFAAKSADGIEVLKVSVYLTSPTALFESQRNRAMWFVLVIATAMVAAVFGLGAAWGGFNRQLRLNEMKSNFVASVSHELRAPIASVRLLAESLERGKISEPAKQNEYFRFIGQECRRLSALIENVLDFSRIEQGRKQYEFAPTDLGALVEQTVKLMAPYAAEKGVRLVLESAGASSHINEPAMASDFPAPGLTATLSPSEGAREGVKGTCNLELNVDGRALQQALVNLIDNAIKHSPKDAVVTVRLEDGQRRTGVAPVSNLEFSSASGLELTGGKKLETAATAVLLSVADSGPGIPTSEQEKIFERFYRLGSELRRETPGVGIGLSIVQHVVEAHGGRVRVTSEVGQGSRFTIELPGKPQMDSDER